MGSIISKKKKFTPTQQTEASRDFAPTETQPTSSNISQTGPNNNQAEPSKQPVSSVVNEEAPVSVRPIHFILLLLILTCPG